MNESRDIQSSPSHEEWELRLQDWLDGTCGPAEAAAVQTHLASCVHCVQLAERLRSLDAKLSAGSARPTLPGDFETKLFARIDAQEAARQRHRGNLREAGVTPDLAELDRGMRRRVLSLVAASCAALAVIVWLVVSGAVPFPSPATITLTLAGITPLQWISIGVVGAVAAAALTRWLQST